MALVAGRWQAECMRQIRQKLDDDRVNYAVHHSADVDDMAFALSLAGIFAGSYAASPRQLVDSYDDQLMTMPTATMTTPSSGSSTMVSPRAFNFFLLRMLGWQTLSPFALGIAFVFLHTLAYALGYAMAWFRRPSLGMAQR